MATGIQTGTQTTMSSSAAAAQPDREGGPYERANRTKIAVASSN
jgi:hypothetical protein